MNDELLSEGFVVGNRYQVKKHLGTTDAGESYACIDVHGQSKKVVLKVLRFRPMDADQRQRIARDLSFFRLLNHPNLARITDFGTMGYRDDLFEVRDWIEGRNIFTATEGMSVEAILRILIDLATVLRYMHTRGIVHGNLTPSNILSATEDDNPYRFKVMDYGLVRNPLAGQHAGGMTALAFAAPEVLMGAPPAAGSDMYSLGVLTYYLLVRRMPFLDDDPEFLIQKQLQSSVDMRPVARMKGGDRIVRLMQMLLEKDPDRRIQSADQVLRHLTELTGRFSPNVSLKELGIEFSASRLVGREKEMSKLQSAALRVKESGRGWAVFISGEAGSGKTRCMEELRSWALIDGWQIVEGTCEACASEPYAPYRQILSRPDPSGGEALFRFDDKTCPASLSASNPSASHAAGQYRDLLTRELVRRMRNRATLVLLHDFHLADEATATVLDYLIADVQSHPVMICVSLRSGEEINEIMGRVVETLIRQQRGEIISLNALDRENVEHMIESMTGDRKLKIDLGSWIYKGVGGNPFFIQEVLKHLIECQILVCEGGRWIFSDKDAPKINIPASVGAILLRRLEMLTPAARNLANILASFQGDIPLKLMEAIMAQDATLKSDALQELCSRQMVSIIRKEAGETVEFVHSLIGEAIRSNLSEKMRQSIHLMIAEVLKKAEWREGHLQELAMHYMQAGVGEAALPHVLEAATQARSEFAHEKALVCFEYILKHRTGLTEEHLSAAAIEASDTMFALGLPKGSLQLLKSEISRGETLEPELKARMYMQLALSYQHLGNLRMQEICCKKGLSFFNGRARGKKNMTEAMLWAELAMAAILQSHIRQGLIFLERARDSCPAENSVALKGRIENMAASMHRIACNLREARAASEKAAAILSDSGESYLACSAYSTLGGILGEMGRFTAGLDKHSIAVSLSDKSRSLILRSQALGNMAECLCRMGHTQEAITIAESARRTVQETNSPAIIYAFQAILAETRIAAGNYRGALEIVDELLREAKRNQTFYTVGHVLYVAACLDFILGRFDRALSNIAKLCDSETRETPFYERELAEALKARILLERGDVHRALADLRALEAKVTKKHWPYQMCIIKLYICEILLRLNELPEAVHYAKNALRLAKAMAAVSLQGYGHLLLGLIYSPVRDIDGFIGSRYPKGPSSWVDASMAIKELTEACRVAEPSFYADVQWRAHAELSRILRLLPEKGNFLDHAYKAHELLCKTEDEVPYDLLPVFCSAFGRGQTKAELVRLIESGGHEGKVQSIVAGGIQSEDDSRALLRMSATVGSVRELDSLLETILDQMIQALRVQRAFVFLIDELTGNLRLAKGRNDRMENITDHRNLELRLLADVLDRRRPIVSANAGSDARFRAAGYTMSGKLYCAPLKHSDRISGILYADHVSPEGSLTESSVNLFAAICNIAAMAIENAMVNQHLRKGKSELEEYLSHAREEYSELIGCSVAMELLRSRIGLIAASPVDILITGESGTGKELVARAIHRLGRRKTSKFIAVDCGALTDSLAEAELFGFRKGAFTGAVESREGLLEAAHKGILFLDELSNLPFATQAKLLRVLQEREVRRLGETTARKIDIQVIAATNKDLMEETRSGRFRSDLYYRLKIIEIRVPPLRERLEDIPILVEWFLKQSAESGQGPQKRFTTDAMGYIQKYSYPGNVRELRNIVLGAYYSTTKLVLGVETLPPEVRRDYMPANGVELDAAYRLYHEILEGNGTFESLIQEPFSQHQFGISLVRAVIQKALEDAGGVYKKALGLLRVPEKRYSLTMQFLKHNNCYLDFRPFRRNFGQK